MNQRDAFIERLKDSLAEWNAEIEALAARARQAGEQTRERHQEDIDRLKARRDEALRRLDELQASSEEAWDDMRLGADEAWEHLRDAWKKASSRFK
ncbi:hypothetical protein [Halomonas caseinilytica]|uniref:Uncharacterized protein n=1 Tax=Halomonas caseinilytica TaxID=438744 RepID=A0A1M6QGA9_9GAMM|nr:hypothetical protein [Halomonas caseinilytica]SHK19344.1 hypothetical protein SAMN05192556_1027 [Halomonas caseinilytica]